MRGRWVVYHSQDERSVVKVTQVVSSFGPVRSVALSLFDWITSYVAYIQQMRGQCVVPHFQSERSKIKVTWFVSSFGPIHSVALSLFGWITSFVAYIQHMRRWCVAHHFLGCKVKGQGHMGCSYFTLGTPSGWIFKWPLAAKGCRR